jgi:hypothetical protein
MPRDRTREPPEGGKTRRSVLTGVGLAGVLGLGGLVEGCGAGTNVSGVIVKGNGGQTILNAKSGTVTLAFEDGLGVSQDSASAATIVNASSARALGASGATRKAGGGDQGQLYVSSTGSDKNDGRSWASALATIGRALSLNPLAHINAGEGTFTEAITLAVAGCHVEGCATDGGTIIRAPSNSGSVVVMQDRTFLSNLRIDAGPAFNGTMLEVVGTRCHVSNVDLHNGNMNDGGKDAQWQHGLGGIGLHTHEGEGCQFDSLSFTKLGLAMLIGGANHVFINARGDQCFKVLNYDTSSGAHLFLGSKFVGCGNSFIRGGEQVETINIGADGNSCFIICDWDESDNSLHTVNSHRNEFIKHTISPGCVMNLTANADHNVFRGLGVLGHLTCNGTYNEFWTTYTPGSSMVINGQHNLVYDQFPDSWPVAGDGVRRLMFSE